MTGFNGTSIPLVRDLANGTHLPVAVEGFAIPPYTQIELGYTGNDLTSVTYKDGATTVATLTLTYSNGQLTLVTRS